MTLALATIPADTARLPRWLEERLVGGELRALVAELAATHDAKPPTDSIRDRLGDLLEVVYERGLATLPHPELRHLLRQPYHLLELQELVLTEGGPYWDSVPRSEKLLQHVRAGGERIEEALFGRFAEPYDSGDSGGIQIAQRQSSAKPYGWLRAVAATAAIVFLATFGIARFLLPPPERSIAWGWAKADAFPSNLTREAYLKRLADEADEWFNKRPQTAPEVAKRIAEFRQGCTALLLANHHQLTRADQEWLKTGCRTWRELFYHQLEQIEDDGNVGEVLIATDAIVRKLSKALRDRAATS